MLAGFQFNVAHQGVERIVSEVEKWYETAQEQAGVEWLPAAGISNFLFNDLGYEDMDEFEDAIQGSFQDFLGAFPHIDVREEGESVLFRVRCPAPGPPRKLRMTITSSKQLIDTTFLKAPDAQWEVPSLEFSVGADQKRHIDSLYNHVVTARDDLERYAQSLGNTSEERQSILDTVNGLTSLLDVDTPFEIVVTDPKGLSDIRPIDDVKVEEEPG